MLRRKLPLLVSLLLPLALLAAVPAAAQESGPIYVVQAGDTLSGIAQTFGTSVNALVAANGLSASVAIQPGQELTIPGLPNVEGVLTTEVVQPGDNLAALAWRYDQEPETLARLNRVLHDDRLYVGQSIIVPIERGAEGALRQGRGLLAQPEEPPLVRAVRTGVNPWSLAVETEEGPRRWWLPGEIVPLPEATGASYRPLPAAIVGVTVWPAPARQGETLVVEVERDGPLATTGTIGEWALAFVTKNEGESVALQGIHAMAEPGLYDLELSFEVGDEGGSYAFRQPFPVRSGNYPLGPILQVPEETLLPENTEPEEELIAEVLAPVTEEKRWEGPFSFPSTYFTESFPSHFGVRRNYNNRGYNAYHTGLDFYGGVGVEIVAPAPGVVVFSGELTVRGQTTIIDHGWGVYTMYMHQAERLVEEGEEVEIGDLIGLVGDSGRVTGPHLHWEVRVGGIPVEPLDWVEGAYPPES